MSIINLYFIVICWIAALIYIGINAFKTKRVIKTSRWSTIVLLVMTVAIILFVFSPFRTIRFRYEIIQIYFQTLPLFILIAAYIISLSGLGLLIWARKELGRNWSPVAAIKENHDLITTGPYAYIRHPMYSGFLLLLIGTFIFTGKIILFILLVAVVSVFWIKALQEEKLLSAYFRNEYIEYKRKTKLFIPFLF